MCAKDKPSVPLTTNISQSHRDKLDQLKASGININIVIEQGIDAVYERVKLAGMLAEKNCQEAVGGC